MSGSQTLGHFCCFFLLIFSRIFFYTRIYIYIYILYIYIYKTRRFLRQMVPPRFSSFCPEVGVPGSLGVLFEVVSMGISYHPQSIRQCLRIVASLKEVDHCIRGRCFGSGFRWRHQEGDGENVRLEAFSSTSRQSPWN